MTEREIPEYSTEVWQHTYNVQMISHLEGVDNTQIVAESVMATDELDAIAQVKESLWEDGFDIGDVSVLSAHKIIQWN